MHRAARLVRLFTVLGLAAAGCSDSKPAAGQRADDSAALKKEADLHKKMHEHEAHGR